MGSLYSVSELRGSLYLIVLPDILYAFIYLINGRLEAYGIILVLVCFSSLPTTIGASDQDFPLSTGGGGLFFLTEAHKLTVNCS